jgi:hypothetical protein
MKNCLSIVLCGFALVTGCAEEPKPRSVTEFLENPIVLEAAVVRCAQNRTESRYDAECVNARQAISIIEAKEERARRDAFEAESDKKRRALRRTQQAAAEARRRATEAERLRKEAEYLAQFGELPPPPDGENTIDEAAANAPTMVIPEAGGIELMPPPADSATASDGGNAPVATVEPVSDLDAVREELRKRGEEQGNPEGN